MVFSDKKIVIFLMGIAIISINIFLLCLSGLSLVLLAPVITYDMVIAKIKKKPVIIDLNKYNLVVKLGGYKWLNWSKKWREKAEKYVK